MKFLVPIDGSESSRRAVEHVIRLARRGEPPEIHLLNVRGQVDAWEVRRFLSDAEIAKMQIHEGEEEIRANCALIETAGLAYQVKVMAGPVAETIARYADEQGCDIIIMGTHGRGGLSKLLMGSVAGEVVEKANVPVTLVK